MGRKIVLIDDEADLVLMLTHALQQKGFEVHSAGSGDKGLELIEAIQPDAVICDLMMPGTSGLEVCRRLRADEKTKSLPLLVISALGAESGKPEAFWAAGLKSDDFISKPFEPIELIGRLEYVLRKSQYVSAQAAGGGEGKEVERVALDEAAPKVVVRSFIESWNAQDFETEFNCMDEPLRGGLALGQYIGRRRQVYGHERGQEREQTLVKVISQKRSEDQTILTCERKDTVRGRAQSFIEEYRLRKTPEGWKIAAVKREK